MSITVYSQPSCVQCTATYRTLDKLGLDYDVVDLANDDDARDRMIAMGYLQAPIVVDGDESWSGFRPDRIKAIAARKRAA